MHRKRRSLVLTTGAAALVALAVVGASSARPGASETKVVYIQGITGNPFYTSVTCGAQSQAKKLGVDFTYQGPNEWSVGKQTDIVNAVAASKPNVIMISVADPKAMIAPLNAAKSAGIKIITIDGDLAVDNIATSNIQSDNVLGGRLGGERLAKVMGGKGTVVALDNEPGIPISEQRIEGLKLALKKYPKIKFLGVKYTHNSTATAANIVSTTAGSNSDLAGVFAAETNNSEGAITGIREAKKTGKVHLVGYDTSDPIVAALQAGKMDGAVVQYPRREGELGIQFAVRAANGKAVPRQQGAPFVIATPKNVDTPLVKKFIYSTHC
jgi:ribose transport system substrate-binding protein